MIRYELLISTRFLEYKYLSAFVKVIFIVISHVKVFVRIREEKVDKIH